VMAGDVDAERDAHRHKDPAAGSVRDRNDVHV
jgi:hypothetical protein